MVVYQPQNPVDWSLQVLSKEQDDPNPTAAYGNLTISRIGAMHNRESFESRIKEAMGASIEQDFFKSILNTKQKKNTQTTIHQHSYGRSESKLKS